MAEHWPAEQFRLCGEHGVFEWFIDPAWGGQAWREEDIIRGYLALSAACLTTTFVLTQRTGACRRIEGCGNETLRERVLPGLASGELFATVGISHLTTSRRHLAKPVLTAEAIPGGFRLDGMAPWVTGGAAADVIVLAATLIERGEPTDRQLLIAAPTDIAGLSVAEPLPLIGVSASSTGPVHLSHAEVTDDWLIAGPVANVMASGLGASTGGYETSTLAIGLAQAAIDFLAAEAAKRPDLAEPMLALRAEHASLRDDLLAVGAAKQHVGRAVLSVKVATKQRRTGLSVLRAKNRFVSELTASYREPPKRRYRLPRDRVMLSVTRPGGGAARHCFFWFGAALSRCLPPICAS